MDISKLKAIDVHVHAGVSGKAPRDASGPTRDDTLSRMTQRGGVGGQTPDETADFYRQRNVACAMWGVDTGGTRPSRPGAVSNDEMLEAAARHVILAGVTTLSLTAAGGTNLGSALPPDRAFSLGGPQSFPGYSPGEVRAGRYWTVQGNFFWRVADILPILNQALYGGIGIQGGHVYERVDPVPDGDLYGISGYIGGRTPLGTVTVGVGKATGSWAGWVTLGTPVGSGSILDHPIFR